MKSEKPKGVYVTVRAAGSSKSQTTTLYNTTAAEVIAAIAKMARGK